MSAAVMHAEGTTKVVRSTDGTTIGFHTVGTQTVGGGAPVIVVGGAMRAAHDYLPLAHSLASERTVHVVDRRGRGLSGPHGDAYSIEREVDDLLAVQAATGATAVFGHSYGGLIALETAVRSDAFTRIAVYEPGVSICGSIPLGWMPRYAQLVAAGRPRTAFAYFMQRSGHAPGPVAHLPLWYVDGIMRMVVRGEQWRRFEPLLAANLPEHEQVAALDGTAERYAAVAADVLLLAGARSPAFSSTALLAELHRIIPASETAILDGLDHNAPDEKAPARVADAVRDFLARA